MRRLICILIILVLVIANLATAATKYAVTHLGKLPGCDHSAAMGINNKGQIVGQSWGGVGDGPYKWAVFMWENGRMTEITPPSLSGDPQVVGTNDRSQILIRDDHCSYIYEGGKWAEIKALPGYASVSATALNDRGEVAGICSNGPQDSKAFLWRNGTTTALSLPDDPGHVGTVLLNDNGQVGIHVWASPYSYTVVWDSGSVSRVDVTEGRGPSYSPHDYADDGTFVGVAEIGDLSAPFVLREGKMTLLQFPGGGDRAGASYINSRGIMVGWYWNSSKEHPLVVRPIVWQAGNTPIQLPSLCGRQVTAHGLNDLGTIVGELDRRHAIMWTPMR